VCILAALSRPSRGPDLSGGFSPLPLFVLQLHMTKQLLGVAYLIGELVGSNARA
jgi:hypothetical protein